MYKRLSKALRSEAGAIDLASIMVGIIVIGLIGGVIAATIFAVIPWAQDNAAKQQLANIAPAQSAYAGMNSDPANGGDSSYGNLTDETSPLASTGLMTAQPARYCSTASADGKAYVSYAKSDSGKIFTSTSNAAPTVFTGDISDTCLTVTDTPAEGNPPAGQPTTNIPAGRGVVGSFFMQSTLDAGDDATYGEITSTYSCSNGSGAYSCSEPAYDSSSLSDEVPISSRELEGSWQKSFDAAKVTSMMVTAWEWCEAHTDKAWADAYVTFDSNNRSIVSCTGVDGSSVLTTGTGVLDQYFAGMFDDTTTNGLVWFKNLDAPFYSMRYIELSVHNVMG